MSRIPKFSFGFRRSKVEDEQQSQQLPEPTSINRSATPTNPSPSRSAESSPKVARSKSLRLPRPQKYGLKSSSQSSVTENHQNGYNNDDLVPDVKSVKSVRGTSEGLLSPRGRSLTVSGHVTSSSNQSSRSNSPSVSSITSSTSSEKRRLGVKIEGGPNLSQGDPTSEVNKLIKLFLKTCLSRDSST